MGEQSYKCQKLSSLTEHVMYRMSEKNGSKLYSRCVFFHTMANRPHCFIQTKALFYSIILQKKSMGEMRQVRMDSFTANAYREKNPVMACFSSNQVQIKKNVFFTLNLLLLISDV